MGRIALIEDEPGIVDFVTRGLGAVGLAVASARDGEAGQDLALEDGIDLVVLDLMLPRRSGGEILRVLARERPGLPIIILTARGEVRDRVDGLRAGAIDYLVKPFALAELEARIRAQLRAVRRTPRATFRCGTVHLDRLTRHVSHDGQPVKLSTTEFELLAHFMESPGRVLSRSQILRAVWGIDHDPGTNLVDVYVGYLRRKLGGAGRTPVRITAVRSRGYRLEEAE